MPLFLLPLLAGLRRLASAIPAWAWGALAVALAFAWEAHSAHRWHARAVAAEASLASVRAVQVAVNKSAAATKARVETAQAIITKGTTDANDHAHAVAGNAADALRLRISDLESAAKSRVVSGVSGPAAFADAQIDFRLPLTDELALRTECETQRIDHDSLIDWVAAQAAVDRTPVAP